MKELVLYRCEICSNLICMVEESGVTPECCGMEMRRVRVNQTDGAHEKHVPVIHRDEKKVRIDVGEAPHPMEATHLIQWIALLTDRGLYVRYLCAGDAPKACFHIKADENLIAAYAYCNLHGLYKCNA